MVMVIIWFADECIWYIRVGTGARTRVSAGARIGFRVGAWARVRVRARARLRVGAWARIGVRVSAWSKSCSSACSSQRSVTASTDCLLIGL